MPMTTTPQPFARCKHKNREFIRSLPFFAGEGYQWICYKCGKKGITKTGDNFLSSALRK